MNNQPEPEAVAYPGWEQCHAFAWPEYPDNLVVVTNASAEAFAQAVNDRTERLNRGEAENIETTLNRAGFFAAVGTVCEWRKPIIIDVINPDGLAIDPDGFESYEAAGKALERWITRYERQGYYRTASGEQIDL